MTNKINKVIHNGTEFEFESVNGGVTSVNGQTGDVTIPAPDLSNYIAKDNTTAFTPTGDYNPATKKYVDDNTKSVSGIGTTQPSNPVAGSTYYDTTNNILMVYDGSAWGAVGGSDYSWVTKTISSGEVEIGLRTIVEPTSNFTLTAPATLKEGEEYVIRTISITSYTMTLGTGFTNPWNVDTTLSGYATDQYVFLAIGGELELQPLVATGS